MKKYEKAFCAMLLFIFGLTAGMNINDKTAYSHDRLHEWAEKLVFEKVEVTAENFFLGSYDLCEKEKEKENESQDVKNACAIITMGAAE